MKTTIMEQSLSTARLNQAPQVLLTNKGILPALRRA